MRHPQLTRKLADQEFERRSRPWVLVHLLALLPLAPLVLLSPVSCVPERSVAIAVSCACYVAATLLQYAIARREILRGLRREGVAGDGYRPPLF